MKPQLTQAVKHWEHIAPIIKCPSNKKEFNNLINTLDDLLDIIGNDENHHLIGLVDVISNLIAYYEENNCSSQMAHKGIDALKFLMDTHQLSQSDLPEIGSQGVVSEILNEKRQLNLRQIRSLAKRFNVDPATFVDNS